MFDKIIHTIRDFFRPPPSEASQMDPVTGLAGLFIETCYRDGGLRDKERAAVDRALVDHLKVGPDEATEARVRAEEIQWTNMTPIGFAMAASQDLDHQQREAVIRTMIEFTEADRQVEAMENRLILQTANCFGINSGRVEAIRQSWRLDAYPD